MFAVDLGAWSVKLAIASPGIRGASLLHVVERLVPPGEGSAEPRAKAVLAQMIDELRLRDETGYIGVYGDQVFTQVLEFGFKNLRRAELDKAVGGELEGVVPVDLEDMVYTFEPLPSPPATAAALPGAPDVIDLGMRGRQAAPTQGMRVLTYAMRRDRAEHLIQLGTSCGFNPRGVLACGGAAIRLVAHTPSLARARAEGAVAVLDIGHDRTDVVVVADGKAVFSRSIARAGKHVTDAIAKHWRLPWQDAERAKHSDGFVASQAEPATSDAWARIHQVTISELQPFARDLRQTLAACRARTGFTALAAVVVGGGGRLRGIGSFLTEQLGIPAWRLTPDDIAGLAGPKVAGDLTAAAAVDSAAMTIGMAYDCAGGRPLFDLRSGALAVKMDLSFLRAKAAPLGAAVIAIAAFAAVSAYADLYRLRKAEKVLTTRLANESAAQFGEAKSAEAVLSATGPGGVNAISPLPRMSAYDILLEISAKVPAKDKITLDIDQVTIDDQKVDITGTTKTAEGIDLLVTELKKVECFKDVSRGPTDTTTDGTKKFKLTITSGCM
ncbi:MAG: pilus assembly protein PilM [Deltaproteobacteria bacterium]|nr:pilus assembly protein PilM [Deltaproteobacteria bacterium]